MQTVFFPLSAYPQGVPDSARYRVSIDRKTKTLLDVTLINAPREIYGEPDGEGAERQLIGWEADMDYMSCAEPASLELAKTYFGVLAGRFEYIPDEEQEELAYNRALPPVPPPPGPEVIYSKLKIYEACATLGLWNAIEAWMKATTVDRKNAYKAWESAQLISNKYPRFDEIKAAISEVTGKTIEEIDEILSHCVADEAELNAANGKGE